MKDILEYTSRELNSFSGILVNRKRMLIKCLSYFILFSDTLDEEAIEDATEIFDFSFCSYMYVWLIACLYNFIYLLLDLVKIVI